MDTNRDYRVLELGKVLEMLAAKCSCADTADQALRIQPQSDLNKVHEMLLQSKQAAISGNTARYSRFYSPPSKELS